MIQSPPGFTAEEGFGVATGVVLGSIPGGPASDKRIWHTAKVSNYLLYTVTELNALGQVYVYDITNPLMPMLLWTIVLPDTGSGNCFLGIPNTATIASGGTHIPSFYGLYFPTDNPNLLFPTSVCVFESSTGSAWKLDITTGTVTTHFFDQRLRNKCPRSILGTNIWFTEDGNMEQVGGDNSAIAKGDVVVANIGTFTSGALLAFTIFSGGSAYPWAATFDGASTIWFAGDNGSLAKFNYTTLSVVSVYVNAFPVPTSRMNIKLFGTQIFASSLGFVGQTTGTVALSVPALPTITRVSFANFTPPGSIVANNASHYNALPLGNCAVAVTYDNYADVTHPQGGVALFKTDGSLIEIIPVAGGDIYNVISIGISGGVYTPNNLI
jgi:hypothetical protein